VKTTAWRVIAQGSMASGASLSGLVSRSTSYEKEAEIPQAFERESVFSAARCKIVASVAAPIRYVAIDSASLEHRGAWEPPCAR
jgi:hypothetical protein